MSDGPKLCIDRRQSPRTESAMSRLRMQPCLHRQHVRQSTLNRTEITIINEVNKRI